MTIPYDDGIDHGSAFGRVDLVDRTTGAIWEIKPQLWPKDWAVNQLKNYEGGTFLGKDISFLNPKVYNGCPESDGYKLSESFTKHRTGLLFNSTYHVNYNYTGDGIINYSYTEELTPNTVTTTVAVVALFLFGVYRFVVTGDPSGLQPAF